MPEAVTIYCCGTRYSRANKAVEAVAFTWDNTTSRKFILDGPGSPTDETPIRGKVDDPNVARILKTEDLMKALEKGDGLGKGLNKAGLPNIPKTGSKSLADDKFQSYRSYSTQKDGSPAMYSKGSLFGVGTADNVIMAIQWLWEQFYVGKKSDHTSFSTINLVGFSRGAVTCIMLAHAIDEAGFKKKNDAMKVNIFNFDPVPGSSHDFKIKGTFDSTGRVGSPDKLPKIVKEYNSVLMENVTSSLFKCVSPKEFSNAGQLIKEYPLPGQHGDSVAFLSHPSAKIAIHLCHNFLTRNGTEISSKRNISDFQLLEEYAELRLKVLDEGASVRQIAKQRENLIVNVKRKDLFYINGHHCEIFRANFPELVIKINANDYIPDFILKKLQIQTPKTLKVLNRIGYIPT